MFVVQNLFTSKLHEFCIKWRPIFSECGRIHSCIFSIAILTFDGTGGRNISGGRTAGVVRTSTGGSPSRQPFSYFQTSERRQISPQEPRRSRWTVVTITCYIHVLCCVRLVNVCLRKRGKKSSSETAGAPVGFSDFGWQHSRFCTAAFGSTFHMSWLAKLISEEFII